MGFLDKLKAWLATESAEAGDAIGETRDRLSADLDRREAELRASPAERMDILQDRIDAGDDTFAELRDRIEGRSLGADAAAEVAERDREVLGDAEVADGPIDADPSPAAGGDD